VSTLKSVDTRKSFPCKAVTTCRHFWGYSSMRASFAPRQTTQEAQFTSTSALDCDLRLNYALKGAIWCQIIFAVAKGIHADELGINQAASRQNEPDVQRGAWLKEPAMACRQVRIVDVDYLRAEYPSADMVSGTTESLIAPAHGGFLPRSVWRRITIRLRRPMYSL
jgi:hypothetical protein